MRVPLRQFHDEPPAFFNARDILVAKVVVQPTTLCNLNCRYCYLPGRQQKKFMTGEISNRVAKGVERLGRKVVIIWHGGEPLACGRARFLELLEPFEHLRLDGLLTHSVQTNGTFIDQDWCRLFQTYDVRVGLSVDGPDELNAQRVDWSNRETFDRVMNAASLLTQNHLRFSVIVVVSEAHLKEARRIYEFLQRLGAASIGFNICERENANEAFPIDDDRVTDFWRDLFSAWIEQPSMRVREFSQVLSWMSLVDSRGLENTPGRFIDLIPTDPPPRMTPTTILTSLD